MKTILFFIFTCGFFTSFSQSVTIKDDAHKTQNCASPYNPTTDNTYGQTIYYESEIQAKGTITAISFYSNDTSLAHSDALDVYMGITSLDYLYDTVYLIKRSKMTPVFNSTISYAGIPGWVTIPLTTPLYYNGDSNLVIAINELKTGLDSKVFSGSFKKIFGNKNRGECVDGGPAPVNLNFIESMPPYTFPSAGGSGIVADIIIYGLTRNSCWTPQKVRFSNLTDHSAKMMWSPPDSGNVPDAYDVYFATNRYKPLRATIADSANIADSQLVVNNLSANTRYIPGCAAAAAVQTRVCGHWLILLLHFALPYLYQQ